MTILNLHVENLRNLAAVTIEPDARLNHLYGSNGAGKTSVLEAISVLSRGRSFRTPHASELTGPEERAFRVFAQIRDPGGTEHRIGLERSSSHWRGRIDGSDVRQLSQLSKLLPLVVLEPDSHLLVSGPPDTRRRFLDWGMFHVERGFLEEWRAFSRALKQRNSALRAQHEDVLDSVDDVLARHGMRLDAMRKAHADQLSGKIDAALDALKARIQRVELSYLPGWKGESYAEALVARRSRDLDRGNTGVGPHRADLGIVCDGVTARTVLSRGEQKALAAAMLVTQAELMKEHGQQPVLLLDDLASEFDREHFDAVLTHVLSLGGQAWVTGTEKTPLNTPHSVFHVEQGAVQELV
ncbi:MAG: DNA replication/repair protein RecF [Xanthomonadales bacterium]|nr:DNA replication/repair protein RecF [Gammaproteobacteria bacterium]MBT8050929.1 DNA replication/repair protein RecF [Gammaproteobacteria bacterium]MBT8057297.1 DNA replication/repair protein RecF [Gammaproteobacteria bacterium]NNJ78661.1 DNA replication/repair protein RecF [Xanthomonadales bacterium]NNL05675.1 DNA replication/repair protein RecF [Xanthomonadales bacterium]